MSSHNANSLEYRDSDARARILCNYISAHVDRVKEAIEADMCGDPGS